ncbi:MAG TPA: efflux RND transporter periplasmic adaptor subunit [Polyangiaceae bacterium]|jgi:HlyD family secretion protein|nr:MAG: Macrolide export protein MacA [Deltaproteobacteria bacterium ADurb.Bin207]HNS99447.1 efflux RND transporter periplasmic adaptor subunit [Polyangiaceae bacterium]HNZ21375.1 efflux RND transporter periplasmic adaptor subunit [Polyangiaceae bacterium]HOD23987.1 efflux RND transporter periplasmic adaptor subunit [Polyangiaceae bacterium]HOE47450.1 efflux RND transporter periplasmic adaptor subunit [Polyangiaceae bacterium]
MAEHRSSKLVTLPRIALLLVALTVIMVFFWHRSRGPLVQVVAAQRHAVVDRVVASGKVLPEARIHLGTVVLGTVVEVSAREGEGVKKGQVLIGLDDTEAQALVQQAKASLQQAEARLGQVGGVSARVALEAVAQAAAKKEQARSDLERERSLAEQGASTQERVDAASKAFEIASSAHAAALAQSSSLGPGGGDHRAAVSQVALARAMLDAAKARLAQTRVVAPAEGIVLTRDVEPGDVVQAGRTLMTLAQAGWTGLTVQVDEKNLSLLRLGQRATASADAFPLESFEAIVDYIAPSIDAGRGTIEVRLRVDKPPSYLRTDMTVSIAIDAGTRQNVLLVPGAAVRDATTPSPYVFLLEENHLSKRDIRLGTRAGDAVEVVAGLEGGEPVVLTLDVGLQQGQRVRSHVVSEMQYRAF